MARMKIDMPSSWQFSTRIEVRVTDLNYGNHLANQQFLAYAQEARVRYFATLGYTEFNFGGVSLIQADAAMTFLGEGHLGDNILIEIAMSQAGGSSFNIFYKLTNETTGKSLAQIRTAIVCYDYEKEKPVPIPSRIISDKLFS